MLEIGVGNLTTVKPFLLAKLGIQRKLLICNQWVNQRICLPQAVDAVLVSRVDRRRRWRGAYCCLSHSVIIADGLAVFLKAPAMEFEWDPEKAERNLRKHGVSFDEAAAVFGDPLAITFFDPDHSDDEERFLTLGYSISGSLLIVSHTDRDDRTRIVSARRAARRERRIYEEG